jgi:hypothetical protein
MPDEPSSSSSASSESSEEATNDQSGINQAFAAAITRAESIAMTAQRGPYAAALLPYDITSAVTNAILAGVAEARSLQTAALTADSGEANIVDTHGALRAELVSFMQQGQAWARAKFFFSNPARLKCITWGRIWMGICRR